MRIETGPGWELRLGRWQDVLADVTECDAVITDPPYSERTHGGQRVGRFDGSRQRDGLGYDPLGDGEAREIVCTFAPMARRWLVVFSSHDLAPAYAEHAAGAGLYVFAPLPWVNLGGPVRLSGDGPGSWTCWITAARPKTREAQRSGALPGAYVTPNGRHHKEAIVMGAKPEGLMRAIVRDYSRPGDLIVDPYAGGGTTLLAAAMEGRRAVGAECDPDTFEKAVARLRKGIQPDMFTGVTR